MLLLTIAGLILCTMPAAAHLPHALLWTMLLFFVSMFISAGFVVISLADGMAGKHQTTPGLMAGLCISAWSMATAVAMPLIGRMFDHGQYSLSLRIVAVIPIAGTLIWWLCSVAENRVTAESEIV
jgi:predicted MFS family arabinose efflux permease